MNDKFIHRRKCMWTALLTVLYHWTSTDTETKTLKETENTRIFFSLYSFPTSLYVG
jgi:hypothetical protein